MSLLKLYLPHRSDIQLKPAGYTSYELFYSEAAVKLTPLEPLKFVKDVVTENRVSFEKLSDALQEAWQDIYREGFVEDAWANVAPQAEQQRLEEMSELQPHHQYDDTVANSLCSYELLKDSIRPLLCTMNVQQCQIFYMVRNWCIEEARGDNLNPFHIYISGGAGVGKSHIIKCIYNETSKILKNDESPTDTTVLLTSPTGTAAFNISGFTLHSAFKIPRNLGTKYEPLSEDTLNTLSTQLSNLKLLIIDEISMVDRRVLAYVHGQLKQIKPLNHHTQ